MANMAETIARFEREGIFPASMRLTVTRLRQTAPHLVPRSAKGGGAMSPQCEPHHQTNIILAQGAYSPIDAAKAVTTLRALRWTATETLIAPTSVPHQGAYQAFETLEGFRLGDVLDNWISAMGEPGMRAAMASVAGHEWTMTLCLDGPNATFSQRARNEIQIATFGDRSFTGRAQRLIAMPFRVFVVAGELWQDTLERRGHIFSSQNVNAGPAPTGPASPVVQQQAELQSLNTSELSAGRFLFQLRSPDNAKEIDSASAPAGCDRQDHGRQPHPDL